jgi:hypothetical protein
MVHKHTVHFAPYFTQRTARVTTMSASTSIVKGVGLASAPNSNDSRLALLMKRSREALGVSCRTAPAVDEGSAWAFAITGCKQINRELVNRIGAMKGVSLELRQCQETRLFRPFLRIDKTLSQWPGRLDFAIAGLMALVSIGFVALQFREHLWDFRTILYHDGPAP